MTTLPMTSDTSSRAAPQAAEAGMRSLLSEPMNMRAMCGHTRPMNPMRPVKHTTDAATSDVTRRQVILNFSTSTPSARALSSPMDILFILSDTIWMTSPPGITKAAMTATSDQDSPVSEPTDQEYTFARASSVAHSLRTVLHALKRYMTAIPAMMMVVADESFILETERMSIMGISENRNALTTMAYCPLAKENPTQTASVAPKDAPEDIPVV